MKRIGLLLGWIALAGMTCEARTFYCTNELGGGDWRCFCQTEGPATSCGDAGNCIAVCED